MAESSNDYFSTELSAPGKIIIFGEHSVVYGKKAIAATLGLHTRASLTEDGSNNVTLEFPNIGFEETFTLSSVREYFKPMDDMDSLEYLQSIATAFQDFYSEYGKYSLTAGQRYSVLTFFQSFAYFDVPCSGYVLRVETGLPISSGAGSSASFSVIVTTALSLLHLSKTNKLSEYIERSESDGSPNLTEKLKDLIIERAFLCESIFHGVPSGIDHSVIVHGQTIEFVKGLRHNTFKTIDGIILNILLVDTKVPRSSKKQGEILRKLKDKYPETVLNILDAIGNISNEGAELLEILKEENDLDKHQARLGDLIELNHGLLRCVRLSHDRLEKVCDTARHHGFSAKLTGAGGGGLAFVYIPQGTKTEAVENLRRVSICVESLIRVELYASGFVSYRVRLGGPGLTIKSLSP